MATFRPMTPLAEVRHRLPEQGRIRLGLFDGRPKSIRVLRFTSADRVALDALAATYGGPVVSWVNPAGGRAQWQLVSEAAEVAIALPPDPLGDSPVYELWTKGGCQRRCDGIDCTVPADDGLTEVVGCICNATRRSECKATTRLNVLLPAIPFGGVWRLETHGWNAAQELPTMVEAINTFAGRGTPRAFLGVREQTRTSGGQTKQFIVPYLRLEASIDQALAGAATLAALAPGPAAPTAAALAPVDPDEEVAEATVVEDETDLHDRFCAHSGEEVWSALLAAVSPDPLADDLDDTALARVASVVAKVEAGTHRGALDQEGAFRLVRTANPEEHQ